MTQVMQVIAQHWLPACGDEPTRPCPDLLTADEAVVYLRLNETGVKNPLKSLEGYRAQGLIAGVRLGRCIRFRREDLDKFIQRQIERN